MIMRPALAAAALLLVAAFPLPGVPSALATGGGSAPGYAHYYGALEPSVFPDELPLFIFGGEPSIGVNWNTGNAFFQHGFDTYRVEFDDATLTATWTDVSPPNSEFNVDPILYTDPQTGRTYAGGLDGTCSIMSYTDDDGASWTPMGNACVVTLDHETIVSGPWRTAAGAPGSIAPHPRAVYYCAQASFVTCMTSFDGGLTFAEPSQVSCGFVNPGFHGSLHVGPKGDVYLPFRNCGGQIGVAHSANNGQTWVARPIPGTITPEEGFDPDVATTKSGWMYIGFRNGAGASMASLSKNNGSTWSTPKDIGASLGIQSSTFHEVVAGDDSRAAVAFLGTTTPGDSFAQGFPGVWHLYIATTYDAGATWTTQQVSQDPVQRGFICAGGTTGCPTDEFGNQIGRNLADFMDAQIDKEGRVLVGYADGCILDCAGPSGTQAQSNTNAAIITRQVSGNTLFAAYDGMFGLSSVPGGPYAGDVGTAIPLAGSAVGGAGGYTYAWSVDAKPSGSAAGPSSFSSTTSATPTFTPDLAGAYSLRLTVTDSASASATAVASLVASAPSTAILTDPEGDSNVNLLVVTVNGGGPPGTDITSADITSETTDDFTVELRVADLAAAAPTSANTLGIPWGADTIYTVAFSYEETPGNVVRYQVAASKYAVATPGNELAFELQVLGAGTTNFVSSVTTVNGEWDADNDRIVWTVPKGAMVVKTAPTGATDPGVMTGGVAPSAGDKLTAFSAQVRTWVFALVGAGPGNTVWDTATSSAEYTFGS